jgi:hypothetical protein
VLIVVALQLLVQNVEEQLFQAILLEAFKTT